MKIYPQWMSVLIMFLTLPVLAFENMSVFDKNQSKYKVLVFLSQSCPCSRSHVEHLNSISEKYADTTVFGVITDSYTKDTVKEIEAYYADKNFKFSLIKDSKQVLVKKYGALKTPHSVLLEKNAANQYRMLYQGGVSDSREFSASKKKYLSENLIAVHDGKPIKYMAGKSLGCYIRRL